MNKITMAVSEDEQNLILDMRDKVINERVQSCMWRLLRAAYEYNKWLSSKKECDFSNFIKGFGYEMERDGEDPYEVYKAVELLLTLAYSKSKEIVPGGDNE